MSDYGGTPRVSFDDSPFRRTSAPDRGAGLAPLPIV